MFFKTKNQNAFINELTPIEEPTKKEAVSKILGAVSFFIDMICRVSINRFYFLDHASRIT